MDKTNIIMDDLLYESPIITTSLTNNIQITFADDTASGRPSKYIDNKLTTDIIPFYSNTHSNAYCGIKMRDKIDDVRKKIRKFYKLTDHQKILFTGTGATGAINHLVNSIDYNKYKHVFIYVSTYEHYSNYLPWVELAKENKKINIKVIPFDINDDIDYNWIKRELIDTVSCHNMNIVSITACSNVTGVKTDIKKLIEIVKNDVNINTYLFLDCACIAPYERLVLKKIDAVFISPHKFVGGTSTPGLLIAIQELFLKGHPYNPGGGCVKKANTHEIIYEDDIEKKETGGTPNIIGIIRLGYVFDFYEKNINKIELKEETIKNYIFKRFREIEKKFGNIYIVMSKKENRLPIISFSVTNMNHNYIVILLNDLFGIQTRGGISCCGMLGEYLTEKCSVNGWCRITFNWIMNKEKIDYIINSVEYILKMGNVFKELYKYNESTNLYEYIHKEKYNLDPLSLLKFS
jgi:selenocysteine lyase/cysteine desulfurase